MLSLVFALKLCPFFVQFLVFMCVELTTFYEGSLFSILCFRVSHHFEILTNFSTGIDQVLSKTSQKGSLSTAN